MSDDYISRNLLLMFIDKHYNKRNNGTVELMAYPMTKYTKCLAC